MDFDLRLVRRIAICGYEGEMNMVMHGGDGSLSLEIDADRLILELTDDGPGIEDRRLKMLTVKWVSARAWDSRT
jgi:anti-sigma regulatory factor (Ser/Thr protein kinase)